MSSKDRFWNLADAILGGALAEFSNPSWDESKRCLEPLAEVRETEEEIVVAFDLPCVDAREDIELNVSEEALGIEARLNRVVRWERWGGYHKRMEFRSFRKQVKLSSRVDPDGARAFFRNGVLRVVLPKVRRRVPIKIE